MEDNNKKTNQLFLDKFRGRTNKIAKNGISFALEPQMTPDAPQGKQFLSQSKKYKVGQLDNLNHSHNHANQNSEIGQLLSSLINPQGKLNPIISKRSTNSRIISNKNEHLPSLYSPIPNYKSQLPSIKKFQGEHNNSPLPPSRSTSDKSENLQKRIFGKYLKLDDEAMKHFQFLQEINRKRMTRRSSAVFSEHS